MGCTNALDKQIFNRHTHRYGLTHFDVSPDNIIIGKGLTVRLLDYGASTAGRELVGASSIWQEHTKYVLAPCEYRSSPFVCSASAKSLLGRYFSLSPSCVGVDSFEFAVTLLHLWAGRGLSPIASNWIVNHTVDLQEGVRKCGTGHSMSRALDDLQAHAEAKHMPVMGDGLKQALAGMLAENWRHRETNVSVAIQAIENRHGGAENFARAMGSDVLEAIGDQKFHVHYARAQTFMEKVNEDERSNQTLLSTGLRNELTRNARFSAHRSLISAETTSQFVEARDLESWARARSAPVELFVPICSTTPVAFYQCVRFCPDQALLLAVVLLVLGRFALRHSTRSLKAPPNKLVRATPVFVVGCVLMPLSVCDDEAVLINVVPVVMATLVLWLTIPFFRVGEDVWYRVLGAGTATLLLAWFWMLVVGGSTISLFILLLDLFAFRFIGTSISSTKMSGKEQSNERIKEVETKNPERKPDKKHVTITMQSAVKAMAMASPIRWTTATRGRTTVRMMSPPAKQSEKKKAAVATSTQQPASKKKRKISGSWEVQQDDKVVESPRKSPKKSVGRSLR